MIKSLRVINVEDDDSTTAEIKCNYCSDIFKLKAW